MAHLILFALPVLGIAVLAMILEARWAARHPEVRGYDARDTAASLSMGVIKISAGAVAKLASLPLFALLYTYRVADLGDAARVSSWLILLVAEDLCFYWFHRMHHGVRVLWAAHVNHHSSQHFNLSTGFRQTVLTTLTSPVFWAPLALLGYPPWMILVAQTWSQIYQFGLHTEAIGRLGPLEWIMNTPSHHRVHHGTNVSYLDRNHGGIFILWDRLFGTFEPERERVVFGLTSDIHTFHPATILFHEVIAMVRDVRRAPTLRAKLGYVLAPPGWSHDGSSQTARELRKHRQSEHVGSRAA